MLKLENWDNNTWLSSKKYLNHFEKFLKLRIKLNKNSQILDIGCGRANIISLLQKKYKFKNKPIGIDILRNKNIKKNIIFKKKDAITFLKKNDLKYDLILIKQTVHFFSKNKLNKLLNLSKNRLKKNGKILIFSLKTKNNQLPCFKKMKLILNKNLMRDEELLIDIKKNFQKYEEKKFYFNVKITKKKYLNMLKNKYISCLLNITNKDLKKGINEIKFKFKNQIKFTDTLKCISYKN
tara:strand:- start:1551 stop:2261 length:711 start_codon:yes stop_codon:yes gene_type:complete